MISNTIGRKEIEIGGMALIAELHGKISSRGSNLSDRLEDKLTADVFGALRYIPFQLGMARILRAVGNDALTRCVDRETLSFWADRMRFWPYHEEGEMDAFLELDHAVIAIEVKYLSGLSSDDDVENTNCAETEKEESRNQLARESRIARQWCPADKKPYLIFIAPESECAAVCEHVISRQILEPGVELGYISWQEILSVLSQIETDEPYQRLVLNDVVSLLRRKGFERFHGFAWEDTAAIDGQDYFKFDEQTAEFSFAAARPVDGGDYFDYR